ncbi:MAG: hypothetical protein R3A44_12695 [Caldilineaceae bacterium]
MVGAINQVAAQHAMDEAAAQLESLLRRRRDVESSCCVKKATAKNSMAWRPHVPSAVRESLQRTLEALTQELAALNQAIKELTAASASLAQMVRILLSMPGVGPKSVHYLLTLLYRFPGHTAGRTINNLPPTWKQTHSPIRWLFRLSPRLHLKMGDDYRRALFFIIPLRRRRGDNPRRFLSRPARPQRPYKVAIVPVRANFCLGLGLFLYKSPLTPLHQIPS